MPMGKKGSSIRYGPSVIDGATIPVVTTVRLRRVAYLIENPFVMPSWDLVRLSMEAYPTFAFASSLLDRFEGVVLGSGGGPGDR